jgi:undecaprenyl diphosphate synthase
MNFKRIPQHVGIIPDGNRRWAVQHGLKKQDGYEKGIDPGFRLYEQCLELGIEEITFYGFTQDNTKRPPEQTASFQDACIKAVMGLAQRDAALLVVGNYKSPLFPKELIPYTNRVTFGQGLIKINFLVNYSWQWDLFVGVCSYDKKLIRANIQNTVASKDVSRIDLIVRWGGRRRLSGFLPLQSVYADLFVVDELWPDYKPDHFISALRWYEQQDITLGG